MKNTLLNNNHNFVLTSNVSILQDIETASAGISLGIESYPLYDYIMQSVFLKMTGAQEQKMKIITWLIATNDYDYRYYRYTKNRLGECSNYNEKKTIYADIIKQIKKYDSSFNIKTSIDKIEILSFVNKIIKDIFINTSFEVWAQKSFIEYQEIWENVSIKHFAYDDNRLFEEKVKDSEISLKNIYENNLYKHRNKIAHNTLSYQQNLPSLKTLINKNYKYENYFLFFAILILIDKLFIELYKKYIDVYEEF